MDFKSRYVIIQSEKIIHLIEQFKLSHTNSFRDISPLLHPEIRKKTMS